METTGNKPDGIKLPPIGFGTWQLGQGTIAKKAVQTAIRVGYRLIDTAKLYGNENVVGEAVRKSGLDRGELFITTKLWNDDQGYDSSIVACEASLDRLGLDYIDLYLIHWPVTSRRNESWRALVELQKMGKTRAIGVSNFTIRHLEELMRTSDVVPQVNQVEFHPFIYEQQRELLAFCNQHGIRLEAYSPISRMKGGIHPAIQEVSDQTGKLPSQVVLRWCIQHGTVPLPRSQNLEHIKTNFEVFDFELDERAMRSLDGISDGMRVTWDPSNMR